MSPKPQPFGKYPNRAVQRVEDAAFPIDAFAGHIITLSDVTVIDSFGDSRQLSPPADGWSLFATDALAPSSH